MSDDEKPDWMKDFSEGKKGEESSTSARLDSAADLADATDLAAIYDAGLRGVDCRVGPKGSERPVWAPADPRTLAWARGVWKRQATIAGLRGVPSLAVAGRETKEAKRMALKNGGCPFDTPAGTRCKACGKVHSV